MNNKKLSDLSVDIGPAVKVTFNKVSYEEGETNYTKWYRLSVQFTDGQGRTLTKRFFEPSSKDYNYSREFAYFFKQLLDNFSPGVWDKIKRPKSFVGFYTEYIEKINKHKGKTCYIKTVPVKNPSDPKEYVADLAYEYISNKPMKYTVLELNQAEDFFTEAPITESQAIKPNLNINEYF